MSIRRSFSADQFFSSPESDSSLSLSSNFSQIFVPKLENLHQIQGYRMSADCISKIMDASIAAQKIGMTRAMDAVDDATESYSGMKFINSYLESTDVLLDACNRVQLRLESIRRRIDLIPIGLHYLESEQEPDRSELQHAAAALESSRFKGGRRHYRKMEKRMCKMKSFGKKLLVQDNGDGTSSDLFNALSGSWAIAALAIGVLSSAACFKPLTYLCIQPPMAEPWAKLLSELSIKIKVLPKKAEEAATMEELAGADLAIRSLLKLISSWQKSGLSSLRRMAVRAVARELRRRKEDLEKTLPQMEEKVEQLYWQIYAVRVSMMGYVLKDQKVEEVEGVKSSGSEESQMGSNAAQLGNSVLKGAPCEQQWSSHMRKRSKFPTMNKFAIISSPLLL